MRELLRPNRAAAALAWPHWSPGPRVSLFAVSGCSAGSSTRAAAGAGADAVTGPVLAGRDHGRPGVLAFAGVALIARVGDDAGPAARAVRRARPRAAARHPRAGQPATSPPATDDVTVVAFEAVREALPASRPGRLLIALTSGRLAALDWRFLLYALPRSRSRWSPRAGSSPSGRALRRGADRRRRPAAVAARHRVRGVDRAGVPAHRRAPALGRRPGRRGRRDRAAAGAAADPVLRAARG
ncbi:hypothetical protein HBB16_21775 [Pseudonocardia sp. MCCB 268]|nr:hypothetical protein [Pseudonocardia cytotoxica]